MAKKDLIVQITVNNAGLEFEDDISVALITIPAEITKQEVLEKLNEIDKEFHIEEDENGDYKDCYYAEHGYNSDTLLEELYVRTGWSYRYLYPEISFTIN